MKLWTETDAINSAGKAVAVKVSEMTADINHQALSRGTRAVNALRNAELEVLRGQRSGKVYKKPYTHGKATKATKELSREYGHKLRGGQLYRASAPGEAPARRSGNLRLHWSDDVESRNKPDGGIEVLAELESGEKYAYYLEEGKGMEKRPFIEKIKEKALPEIERIYNRPFT